MSKTALIAGSFDPITIGHLDIIERACALYDKVIVAVCSNPAKKPLFDEQVRLKAVRQAVSHLPGAEAVIGKGLTADFAVASGADVIIKGVRNAADFAYEQEMAEVNRRISGIETVLLCASPALCVVSSTLVRTLLANKKDCTPYLPEGVWHILKETVQ